MSTVGLEIWLILEPVAIAITIIFAEPVHAMSVRFWASLRNKKISSTMKRETALPIMMVTLFSALCILIYVIYFMK